MHLWSVLLAPLFDCKIILKVNLPMPQQTLASSFYEVYYRRPHFCSVNDQGKVAALLTSLQVVEVLI